MPVCNDPIKVIIYHNDKDSIKNAVVKYGTVHEIITGQNNSTVTFARWFPTGIGANLRSLMQSYMVTDICIEGQMVQVQRCGEQNKKKKPITTKNPYIKRASSLTKFKANANKKAKERSLDSLYK